MGRTIKILEVLSKSLPGNIFFWIDCRQYEEWSSYFLENQDLFKDPRAQDLSPCLKGPGPRARALKGLGLGGPGLQKVGLICLPSPPHYDENDRKWIL